MIGSSLQSKIIEHLERKHQAYVVNVVSAGKDGTSDLVACIGGVFFAFEVKGKGDIETELQDAKLFDVTCAGGYGGYVRSVADVDYIIINLVHYQSDPYEYVSL